MIVGLNVEDNFYIRVESGYAVFVKIIFGFEAQFINIYLHQLFFWKQIRNTAVSICFTSLNLGPFIFPSLL